MCGIRSHQFIAAKRRADVDCPKFNRWGTSRRPEHPGVGPPTPSQGRNGSSLRTGRTTARRAPPVAPNGAVAGAAHSGKGVRQMASETARTVDRREAAVTAALAGGVLVIVGYASGIGLRPATEIAAALPEQPAASAPVVPAPTPSPTAPTPIAPPPAAVPVPASLPVAPTHPTVPMHPSPSPPAAPPASAAPIPSPAATDCPPGLVPSLVGALPVVGTVTSLVTDLLTTPLLAPAGATAVPETTGGPLGCTVGALLATTCCSEATVTRSATDPAP